jgi:hypothetical protein
VPESGLCLCYHPYLLCKQSLEGGYIVRHLAAVLWPARVCQRRAYSVQPVCLEPKIAGGRARANK